MLHEHIPLPGQGGGGAESFLHDVARGLKALGHSVAWWQGRGDISEAIAQFQPDVLHIQTIQNLIPNWRDVVGTIRESGIPHVWQFHDYWPFCKGRHLLTRGPAGEPCNAAKGGICDGECECGPSGLRDFVRLSPTLTQNAYSAAIFQRNWLPIDHVAELGIDTDLFHARNEGERVGICTSSAWPEYPVKGMHVLQAAIAGTGHDVSLYAHLPRERVAQGLRRHQVYVFPSLYEETFGLCLCEAMASGLACIASAVAGAKAQIEDGVTGLLVPAGDAHAMREAILRVMDDDALREKLGNNAAEHVAADHKLTDMAARYTAVYQEVCDVR